MLTDQKKNYYRYLYNNRRTNDDIYGAWRDALAFCPDEEHWNFLQELIRNGKVKPSPAEGRCVNAFQYQNECGKYEVKKTTKEVVEL